MKRHVHACLILVLVLALPACGEDTPTATGDRTEKVTGTLTAGGLSFHTFTIQASGDLTATFSKISPTVTVGAGVGVPSGAACDLQVVSGAVTQGTTTVVFLEGAGAFCISIYDTGSIGAGVTVDYEIELKYP